MSDSSPALNRANQLEDRFVEFAVSVIRLTRHIPTDEAGKHIGKQLLRSGTSPAPNYAEARGAESKADFIHKLGIVRKELNESRIWLRILRKTGAPASELVTPLLDEVTELSRIIESSLKTARSHH